MKITLRPVVESDAPFLLELYASTRAREMALVPWNDTQKRDFLKMQFSAQSESYAKEYPAAQHSIICRDDGPVGRLYLNRAAEKFHILDITLHDLCKNQGTGSVVLREILQEALAAGKPTSIWVEKFNPSVRLFERLGFRAAETNDFNLLLERPPVPFEEPASEPG